MAETGRCAGFKYSNICFLLFQISLHLGILSVRTNIEWADATWNPWHGCTKISPGCKFCYMYREKKRYGQNPELIVRGKTTFDEPLKWARGVGLERNAAGEKIVPHFIFTCSWSDWFIEEADAWRPEAWRIIRATPEFTYLILTKRPWRIADCLPPDWGKSGYPNVWLGVSAENQKYAEQRIPFLLREPAAKKFLSLEPLLAPIDLRNLSIDDPLLEKITLDALTGRTYVDGKWNGFFCGGGVDWVIVGGESGPTARPSAPAVFRQLHRYAQCPRIDELILVTSRLKHRGIIPDSINGKPIHAVFLVRL